VSSNPLAQDAKPAHDAASNVHGLALRDPGKTGEKGTGGGLPNARLKLEPLQLTELIRE
jgi:hypothetical protein